MKYNYLLNIGAREEQQDSCIILENNYSVFLVLADGMGGHHGGAMASQALIREASNIYNNKNEVIQNIEEFFQDIVNNTIQKLNDKIKEDKNLDPHTTCVFALIQNDMLYYGYIGDSRLYFFENNKFVKRTKDHSVTQMLLNMGEISEDEIATHPDQNKLLKSIGVNKDIKITFDKISLKDNFTVLICSDGFWEYISTDEMEKYLFSMNINKAYKTMINLALQRGGKNGDNISIATCMSQEIKEDNIFSKFKNILGI